MFGIGVQELAIVFVIALLVFGPKRLPELARTMGKGLAEFRRASSDLRQSLNFDLENEQRPPPPATPPRPAQAGDLELPTNSDAEPEADPSDSEDGEATRPTEADALNAADDPHQTADDASAADPAPSATDDPQSSAADTTDRLREKSPVASGD